MSRTPWGDAAELRERRLTPGRGTPREEVERNQRERLFAAMVATVAERGYEATRVADVLALAGVSRKAFYRHFADKEQCFDEAVSAMLDATMEIMERLSQDAGGLPGGEKGLAALLSAAAAQPAAARVCVIEAFAAGPGARAKLEWTVTQLEWLAAGLLGEAQGAGPVSRDLARAMLGGISAVSYRMLHERREGELPELAGPLWRWASSLEPPPKRLPGERTRAARPAVRIPFAARVPTERVLRGFAAAVAKHGYADATLSTIASHGKVSLSTFYEHFDGKGDALAAALALVETELLTATLPAARAAEGLGATVAAGFRAAMDLFASEPDLAKLWIVEVVGAGPAAAMERDRLDADLFATVTALGGGDPAELDEIAVEATMGAVHALMYERMRSGGAVELPGLAPLLTYVAVVPFLGAEAAWTAAVSGAEESESAIRSEVR
ncbi:MAG TPA: TetR/AcrR family transcriptional regulator [Solirubrobacterales bacterium]